MRARPRPGRAVGVGGGEARRAAAMAAHCGGADAAERDLRGAWAGGRAFSSRAGRKVLTNSYALAAGRVLPSRAGSNAPNNQLYSYVSLGTFGLKSAHNGLRYIRR